MPKHYKNKRRNLFALDKDDNTIYIYDAYSGKNGYFCPDCKIEMIAHRPDLISSYFRHDPGELRKSDVKCEYSDEKHRHHLAKLILCQLKKVKVPAVKVWPPEGFDGTPNLISEPRFIEAHTVEIEKYFWEDEGGDLHFSKLEEPQSKSFLIKPDIVFFDMNKNPILFIEIVATHKVNFEKLIKIRRLGVDAIEIKVPNGSPKEIEEIFSSIQHTKWLYNNEQERAEYVQVSGAPGKGVFPVDEFERKISEGNFRCRKAQISRLIRSLEICLDTEPYIAASGALREESIRIERLIRTEREYIDRCETEVSAEEFRRYSEPRKLLEKKKARVRQLFKNAKNHYTEKARKINRQTASITRDIIDERNLEQGTPELFTTLAEDYRTTHEELEGEAGRIEEVISAERKGIEEITTEFNSLQYRFEIEEADLRNKFNELEKKEADIIHQLEQTTAGYPDIELKLQRGIEADFENEGGELESEFERLSRETVEGITNLDGGGVPGLPGRIKDLLQGRQLLSDFKGHISHLKRIRAAHQCFKSGSFKNWTQSR